MFFDKFTQLTCTANENSDKRCKPLVFNHSFDFTMGKKNAFFHQFELFRRNTAYPAASATAESASMPRSFRSRNNAHRKLIFCHFIRTISSFISLSLFKLISFPVGTNKFDILFLSRCLNVYKCLETNVDADASTNNSMPKTPMAMNTV